MSNAPHPNEMGDIGPAIELLLIAQAGYARSDPKFSRAMVDVAYNALVEEIWKYSQRTIHAANQKAQSIGAGVGSIVGGVGIGALSGGNKA